MHSRSAHTAVKVIRLKGKYVHSLIAHHFSHHLGQIYYTLFKSVTKLTVSPYVVHFDYSTIESSIYCVVQLRIRARLRNIMRNFPPTFVFVFIPFFVQCFLPPSLLPVLRFVLLSCHLHCVRVRVCLTTNANFIRRTEFFCFVKFGLAEVDILIL